jgi:hypothetical protein
MKYIYPRAIFLYFFLICNSYAWSQTTGFSGTGGNIDVTYYRCQWTIDPGAAKNIAGSVTTYFKTTQANVSSVTLDFNKASFNNGSLSVKYHGSSSGVSFSFPASGNVNIITINFPNISIANTLDSLTINYSGAPPAVSGQAEGYQLKTVSGPAQKVVYSLSESYEDRDWWPCKADMQDKADSLDIIITSPSAYLGAANGALVSNTVTGANRTVFYKHRYPIASYLVAVAVASYTDYPRGTVSINGTNVPVNYYILSGRSVTAAQLATMDYCKQELTAFSSKYGDYPFKNEKYGMYEFPWGGGMEHQSFSAMNWASMNNWSVIAHELMHQWFGDKVTFATWNHLWLAEGFARYGEALAAELIPALGQSAPNERSAYKSAANNATNRGYGCYIPNSQIANSDAIWSSAYGTTVYERGAMIVSMLRTLLGDAKFFQACQNYLNDPLLAYSSAITTDLQNHMQNLIGGYDLTPFFNSYVIGNGYPTYASIDWAQSATNRITFRVGTQSKSTGSTVSPYYYTPIALRVQGSIAGQDTVLVIYDQNGKLSQAGNGISAPITSNIISFNISFNPSSVTFDPFFQTLATNTVINHLTTLPIKITDFTLQENVNGNRLRLSLYDDNNELQKIVLQKSNDGRNFSDAGVMLKESSDGTLFHFIFTDNSPNNDIKYYRAKVTEVTGERFSKILKADKYETSSGNISPNPADKEARIKWKGGVANKQYEVIVTSTEGQIVLKAKTTDNFISLQTGKLPAGMYLVQVKQVGAVMLERKMVVSR